MNELIRELETIAEELRGEDTRMADEVSQGGRQSQEVLQKILFAVHKMHSLLFILPAKLERIAHELKKADPDKRERD